MARQERSPGDAGTGCHSVGCGNQPTAHRMLVSEEKNLPEDWMRTLKSRGTAETYSGDDLKHIGMPVGGICTGQVYLGGDGRLWHWDVFKTLGGTDEPIDPRGQHYSHPLIPRSPIDQGFAIRLSDQGTQSTRELNSDGFSDIQFEGAYPIGKVDYVDEELPISVSLEAFSPFIPLDENNSGLPATILSYTVTNKSDRSLPVDLLGWLENKVCPENDEPELGSRRNELRLCGKSTVLTCCADVNGSEDPSTLAGYGDMSLALLGDPSRCRFTADVSDDDSCRATQLLSMFDDIDGENEEPSANVPFGEKLVGAISQRATLQPGDEHTFRFVVSWYFPRYVEGKVYFSTMDDIPNLKTKKRFYSTQFESSFDVCKYIADNYSFLTDSTRMWVETWYDSSLPYWFLNRTFANTSTLATQTCHRFDSGRFWAWEGVDCCPGTCQHVWNYAQAVARIFPNLERSTREDIDYGIAYRDDGSIEYRAEASEHGEFKSEFEAEAFFAADGQLGTILRVYREHTMCSDFSFLTRIWARVKCSLRFIMTMDPKAEGLLDAPQYNTLDVTWHGKIPWISSMYLAALASGKKMAEDMGDEEFASICNQRLVSGRKNYVKELFNGEYFVHRADAHFPDSMDLQEGSYIDQVLGQGYAMQLGLERVIPAVEARSALESLWKYNFATDVGPYRENFKTIEGGRWYAMPGESGLLMCTWPKNDCKPREQTTLGLDVTSEGYLNECMSGFEYQVATHMVAEGLIEKGLAVVRAIHDRYHPSKRNPYNEVECSDHYCRAMASYGAYLSICGYEYHGPNEHIGFAPKLAPDDFRAAFTAAEGWGTFSQTVSERQQLANFHVKYGHLDLSTIKLKNELSSPVITVQLDTMKDQLACQFQELEDGSILISVAESLRIECGQHLQVTIG